MSIFDYAIKVVMVTVVVLGIMLAIMGLSGADFGSLDEHEVFRYRMVAAPIIIAGFLLADYLLGRRRARLAMLAESTDIQDQPRRGYMAELIAVALLVAGGATFWHDHTTHDIPNAIAVAGKFTGATCVDRGKRTGPHMSIGYEFASLSTSARRSESRCLLANCEADKAAPQYMDTEYKKVFYGTVQECNAALPGVLAAKAPTTVWTGDKDPNAAVRARFTPERDPPPYFLLWLPAAIALVVFLVSGFSRMRRTRAD